LNSGPNKDAQVFVSPIAFVFQKIYHRSKMEDDVLSWKTLGEERSEQFAFLGNY
jgi:hypothetical protein